jgi:hypothetical protein
MSSQLLALFVRQIPIDGFWRLGMLAPLALSIAVVYKTIHCRNLREIPFASLILCISIIAGMLAIGVGLLIVFRLLA